MENGTELMQRIAAGDHEAVAMLDQHYRPHLLRFLARHTSEDIAEDIAQVTFLKVWRKATTYRPGANVATWLFSIAHRTLIDHLRTERRRARLVQATIDLDCTGSMDSGREDLDHRAVRLVAHRIASQHLSFGESAVEDFLADRSHSECSVRYGISASTSRWRRNALIECLANSREFAESFG